MSRRQPSEPQTRDSLGTSTRSDPGLQDEPGTNWEYRMSDQNEFQRLEPEPAYPQDRLRYSRSKSDTDLALSPAESQRYSSPMQPGKFVSPCPVLSIVLMNSIREMTLV